MVFAKVGDQSLIVDVIVLLSPRVPAIAEKTFLVLVSAMYVELVRGEESLPAKTALRMALEATLVFRAWLVVSRALMLPKFLRSKQGMFMGEDLLVP